MKAIYIRQEGSVTHMMKKEYIQSEDFDAIVDLTSILVDTEIAAIYLSNYFSNLQIKNNKKIPAKWVFSNIENANKEDVLTFEEVIELYK